MRDTSHLSLLEHGVYARLIQVYYTREGAISDADKYRLIGARSREERQAVDSVLAEFFTKDGEQWSQARCDREIAAYQTKADKNREVGKKGGRPRTVSVDSENPKETQTVISGLPDGTLANSHKPLEIHSVRTNVLTGGKPPDPAKTAFDTGVALLAPQHGEHKARGIVGKLRKAMGDAKVTELLNEARTRSDAVPWLMKAHQIAEVMDSISKAHGGAAVERLKDGRFRCQARYFARDGREELPI